MPVMMLDMSLDTILAVRPGIGKESSVYQIDWNSKNSYGVEVLDKDELADVLRRIARGVEEFPTSENRIVYFSYKELNV